MARATSTPTGSRTRWRRQQYLPEELAGARYYEPTDRGAEAALGVRLRRIEELLGRSGG